MDVFEEFEQPSRLVEQFLQAPGPLAAFAIVPVADGAKAGMLISSLKMRGVSTPGRVLNVFAFRDASGKTSIKFQQLPGQWSLLEPPTGRTVLVVPRETLPHLQRSAPDLWSKVWVVLDGRAQACPGWPEYGEAKSPAQAKRISAGGLGCGVTMVAMGLGPYLYFFLSDQSLPDRSFGRILVLVLAAALSLVWALSGLFLAVASLGWTPGKKE